METHETKGRVQTLKKDNKGVLLDDDNWYSNNYKDPLKNVNKGDFVKVTYKQNGVYKNYETIEVLESAPQEESKFSKARESKDASQLTSYAKDIVIATIGNSNMPKEEVKTLMQEAGKAVAETYNRIKDIISGKVTDFAGKEATKPDEA